MAGEVSDLPLTLDLLCASKKLDRDKGEEQLKTLSFDPSDVKFLCQWMFEKIEGTDSWEEVHGGLTAANVLLRTVSDDLLSELGLLERLESNLLSLQEHVEFRVRIAAGLVTGSLCHRLGLPAFGRFIPHVIQGVKDNLERNVDANNTEYEESLRELDLAKERDCDTSRSSLSIFHDTAGWKNLETWMKCLQQMVNNLTPNDFVKTERSVLLDLIFSAVSHTNRFVRETGYDVLATLVQGHGCYCDPNASESMYLAVALQLATGLSDNWSQVRMAASRAVRTFFEVSTPPGNSKDQVYPILLPAMCLNRYYVAEGVRIYSQDTWCFVTQGEGKQLLSAHLDATLKYYIQQTDADNHSVREAACSSIAECVSKIDREVLRPHIMDILQALVVCFGDESWPVRDSACSALGTMISQFIEETRTAGYKDLLREEFLRNLSDPIPSLRDCAASSIARILAAASDSDLAQLYKAYICDKLHSLKDQTAESHGAESPRVRGQGPGVSHVVARSGADSHDPRHTNQTMYSCGSLAPKLQKGRKGGGCHDGLHKRASEPWEYADGAVRLIGQMALHSPTLCTDDLFQALLDAAALTHYTHYPYFLETVSRVISDLCNGLEKMHFKRHLDDFLMILALAVESNLPLAIAAAEETIQLLSKKIGPNVLRGRITSHMHSNVNRSLYQYLPPAL